MPNNYFNTPCRKDNYRDIEKLSVPSTAASHKMLDEVHSELSSHVPARPITDHEPACQIASNQIPHDFQQIAKQVPSNPTSLPDHVYRTPAPANQFHSINQAIQQDSITASDRHSTHYPQPTEPENCHNEIKDTAINKNSGQHGDHATTEPIRKKKMCYELDDQPQCTPIIRAAKSESAKTDTAPIPASAKQSPQSFEASTLSRSATNCTATSLPLKPSQPACEMPVQHEKMTTFADPLQRQMPAEFSYTVKSAIPDSSTLVHDTHKSNTIKIESTALSQRYENQIPKGSINEVISANLHTAPLQLRYQSDSIDNRRDVAGPPTTNFKNYSDLQSTSNRTSQAPFFMPSDLLGLRNPNAKNSAIPTIEVPTKDVLVNRIRHDMAETIAAWQTGKLSPDGSTSRWQLLEELRRTEPKQLDQIKAFLINDKRPTNPLDAEHSENILAATQRIIKALAADLKIYGSGIKAETDRSSNDQFPKLDINLAAQLKDRNVVKFMIQAINDWQTGKLIPNGQPVRRQLLETLRQLGPAGVKQLKQELLATKAGKAPIFKTTDSDVMNNFRKVLMALLADKAAMNSVFSPKIPELQLPMVACPKCLRRTQLGALTCPVCKSAIPASDPRLHNAGFVLPPEPVFVREPGKRQSA